MYIVVSYSILDKKSEIVYISNDPVDALSKLICKSTELATDGKNQIIDDKCIHIYNYEHGYLSSSLRMTHILQLLNYEGDITYADELDTK